MKIIYAHLPLKGNQFEAFLKNALNHAKELKYWKIKDAKRAKEVAYA